LATAVETIARTRFAADAERLMTLAAERKAVGFVLGLPINMDGSEGPRAQATRAFARNLARVSELPIALWDERLSTVAVERELIAADVSRAKRKAVIDQHAAVFILQGALDRLDRLRREG
jgi:putative Holliday junction resolvase